jgi:hypothetical protein
MINCSAWSQSATDRRCHHRVCGRRSEPVKYRQLAEDPTLAAIDDLTHRDLDTMATVQKRTFPPRWVLSIGSTQIQQVKPFGLPVLDAERS